MSVRHIGLVLDHYDGPPNLKLLLLILADHADGDTGECFPSYRAIAARACCSERTAMRNVGELIANGYVDVVERGGRVKDPRTGGWINASNVFRVRSSILREQPNLRQQVKRPATHSIHRSAVERTPDVTPGGVTHDTPVVRRGGDTGDTLTVSKNRHSSNHQSVDSVDNVVQGLGDRWSS